MRWWKTFREDFDRPSFQLGIERFGTGFVHDVGRVWQFLCVEDGPGIRDLVLTDEMLGVLARQFRVDVKEASARLDFMANVSNLIDIGTRRGSDVRVISSKVLKNRRDEWSRKVQKAKAKSKPNDSGVTPEAPRSNSGTEADVDAEGKKAKKKTTQRHFESLKMPDSRFTAVKNFYIAEFERRNPGVAARFDVRDGRALAEFLKTQEKATEEVVIGWLRHAFESDATYPLHANFRMREFCAHFEKFVKGPMRRHAAGPIPLRSAAADPVEAERLNSLVE